MSRHFTPLSICCGLLLVGLMNAAPVFLPRGAVGALQPYELIEASGLAASRQNPGVLWTHNDSGNPPGSIFALTTNGLMLGRYVVPAAYYGNFEDIAIGPGPTLESHYLYLGDIGDNFSTRPSIRVFRFPEPAVYLAQTNGPRYEYVTGAEEFMLTYPDGPENAEALMVDPIRGDLFIATKRLDGSRIYMATRAQMNAGGAIALTFIRQIAFYKVSAGDISPDGRLIILRRGGKAAVWSRSASQSVGSALAAAPAEAPLPNPDEVNGEAIGFDANARGYYTTSEGFQPPIYYFQRVDSGVAKPPVTLIGRGEEWRYLDSGENAGTAWRATNFSDSGWLSGPAPLGYGQSDEATVISYGGNAVSKNTATYFRKTFVIPASTPLADALLRLCYTDGIAVYVNGVEVFRRNLGAGASFNELADDSNATLQNYWQNAGIHPASLRRGTNMIAVELHRQEADGASLTFDLQLITRSFDLNPGGLPLDQKPPTVKFVSPAANAVVTNETLTVRGTASDNSSVTEVSWALGTHAFQTAAGTTSWSANVPLEVGTNVVSVVARDVRTNASVVATRQFIRRALSQFTLHSTTGGTVTPNLAGKTLIVGNSYMLTALPAARHLFAGWTGGLTTNAARLVFLMQSNLVLQANFVTNPFYATKGQYRGLFGNETEPAHASSGAATITVTDAGKFTAALRLSGTTASLSGQFDLAGNTSKQVVFLRTNQLTLSLHLDLTNGTETITGQVATLDWSVPLLAYRTVAFANANPVPISGRYTLSIAGSTNGVGPLGHSVAAVTVNAAGSMTLAGTLADGTKVAQSGYVSTNGNWPFYLPLYRNAGFVSSWVTFTNDATASLMGRCLWLKPASTDKLYLGGFTNITALTGSIYSSAAMTNFLATNLTPCVSVTGLTGDGQTNCLAMIARNTFGGPDVQKLALDLPTGIWTGSVTNPMTGKVLPAKLAVHLQSALGFGHVLNTNVSAALEWLAAP